MDLGQMYLFNNKALIARSSSKVAFFRVFEEEDENNKFLEPTIFSILNIIPEKIAIIAPKERTK